MSPRTERIAREAHDLAVAYTRDPLAHSTATLRRYAERMVDLRALLTTSDGSVDWTGRSREYRDLAASTVQGLDADEAEAFRAAARYHVSKVLRERLDPATLEEYGLSPETGLHRSRRRREEVAARLRAATIESGEALPLSDLRLALRLANAVEHSTNLVALSADENVAIAKIAERLRDTAERIAGDEGGAGDAP